MEIGSRLGREDREVRKPFDLRMLDLAVPIGALHKTDHEAVSGLFRQLGQLLDHRKRAFLIGLHSKAETGPVLEGRLMRQPVHQLEAQHEPVCLFRIKTKVDVRRCRFFTQPEQARVQLVHDPRLIDRFKARMQGGKFHRNTACLLGRNRLVLLGGHGVDRQFIGFQVAGRIFSRAGPFTQHVETEMGRLSGLHHALAALEGFLYRPAKDELLAHDPHGLHHGGADDRFSALADQSRDECARTLLQVFRHADHAPGQH